MKNYILSLGLICGIPIFPSPALSHEMEEPPQPPAAAMDTHGHDKTVKTGEAKTPVKEKWFGNFSGIIGAQTMQNSGWKDDEMDSQLSTGFDADFGKVEWPVNLYFGSHSGTRLENRDTNVEDLSVNTLKFGPRYYVTKKGNTRPYITAGVALVSTSHRRDRAVHMDASESEETMGMFANAGVIFKLGRFFHFGLDVTLVNSGRLDGKNDSNHIRTGIVLGAGSE